MKMILFASALALSTAAMAQDATPAQTTPPTADSTATTPQDTTPAMPATPPATDTTATPAATDQSTMPATPTDQGAMSGAGSMAGARQAAQSTDDSNLPMCSRTVTDKCKQGSGSGHHRAMRHHKRR